MATAILSDLLSTCPSQEECGVGSGHRRRWDRGEEVPLPPLLEQLFTAESLAEAGLARPSADAAASTAEVRTMDGTRRRRTRDRARQQWYARERRRRFARFLGFGDRARPAASPPAAGAGRAPAAASTPGPRRTANDQRNSMNDAARDVRVFDGAARADRPLPDGGRLPGRDEHPQPVGDEDRVHCSPQLRRPRRPAELHPRGDVRTATARVHTTGHGPRGPASGVGRPP